MQGKTREADQGHEKVNVDNSRREGRGTKKNRDIYRERETERERERALGREGEREGIEGGETGGERGSSKAHNAWWKDHWSSS